MLAIRILAGEFVEGIDFRFMKEQRRTPARSL
jgi:hypothetical protein